MSTQNVETGNTQPSRPESARASRLVEENDLAVDLNKAEAEQQSAHQIQRQGSAVERMTSVLIEAMSRSGGSEGGSPELSQIKKSKGSKGTVEEEKQFTLSSGGK